ncbi:hypothetical protein MUG84_27025 [Paenibacillus sp. KQZ6P-2]|uniref:Uncharacterized protein n=1 Tax=Paenibacillus mangrovi TaxID=2931978 RepID=A0A9X1WUP1_9BACL|nr:hypothetical protein [Paenibacillus mangrovi]MCJ8015323.1 hypothetical protein [Paenibacillus mangrovi]
MKKMMKRWGAHMKVKYALLLLILLIVVAVVYFAVVTYPRSINTTIRGVNFQLGTEHINNVQPETLRIQGSLSTGLNGLQTFKGTITFDNDSIPVPDESRETTIHFDKYGYGPIVYGYIENAGTSAAKPETFSYGVLFTNSDFSSITYLNMNKRGWNGGDGLMFAGPATTRKQALIISNELMKKFLQSFDIGQGSYVLN